MESGKKGTGNDRRDFLKQLGAAGAVMCLWPTSGFARTLLPEEASTQPAAPPTMRYQYRTVSVSHLGELKAWFETLDKGGKLSKNEVFRKYIGGFQFELPAAMPAAKSLLVVSIPQKLASFTFHRRGQAYVMLIPTGYVDDGLDVAVLKAQLAREVLKNPEGKFERARLPQKTLAVRSGLAMYGKNNVSYVPGYGSFHMLATYFVEQELPDQWQKMMKLMPSCAKCSICTRLCPTQCIRPENFVIDAGRCVALYNEIEVPVPDWMDPKVHHTVAGCLHCQLKCKGNRGYTEDIDAVADFDENETDFLAGGSTEETMVKAVKAKLKRFPMVEEYSLFSRNMKLALANLLPA